ncbi:hypothetical protein BH09PAT3_BH09PAT3_2640 [soil metagenome]
MARFSSRRETTRFQQAFTELLDVRASAPYQDGDKEAIEMAAASEAASEIALNAIAGASRVPRAERARIYQSVMRNYVEGSEPSYVTS